MRRAAARALGKLGWQPPTQELRIAYLFAKQDWDNLVAIGAPAVALLVAALKDENSDVRRAAAKALVKIGAPAVEPLVAALKDEDSSVRSAAVEVLGKLGAMRAVEPLFAAFKDEDGDVRRAAAEALEAINRRVFLMMFG